MNITWLGHSSFLIEEQESSILIDPFLSENHTIKNFNYKKIISNITHIALTHGHSDHIGDTLSLSKEYNVSIIVNADLGSWMSYQGVKNIFPGNIGGTQNYKDFSVTFVNALHSSTLIFNENLLSFGNANGFIFHFNKAPTLYHMGDTDIFSDMQLINELHNPKIGIVPIGDVFTMGGAVAALACRKYFNFKIAIPCHYNTFPVLDNTPEKFIMGLEGSKTKVVVKKVGEKIPIYI